MEIKPFRSNTHSRNCDECGKNFSEIKQIHFRASTKIPHLCKTCLLDLGFLIETLGV